MNKRRTILGLCTLCALLASALAAQSASAITGTTAFTCVQGQGTLRGDHCLTTGSAAAEYGHVAVSQDKTTEMTATNAKAASETTVGQTAIFKVTIAGVPLELSATGVSGSGTIENKVAESGEHFVHRKGTLTFSEVTVKAPAGRGCKVFTDQEATKTKGEEGVVHTRELTATTEGQGDNFKIQPAEGESFASFFVECEVGKQIPAIEGTWTCSGSVKGQPEGATINFTHATVTAESLLKCKGTKAGIDGKLTLSGREKGSAGSYTPLAQTTVTTGEQGTPGVITSSTTAFTCVQGEGTLRGEHCLTTSGAAAEYGHVAVPENTKTELSGSNAKSANETITRSMGRLKVTIAGVPVELTATDVSGLGWVENRTNDADEHYSHSIGSITFTEILVAKPEGRGCKVFTDNEATKTKGEAGVVHTRELTATTEGQGDNLKLTPSEGEAFASFFIECEAGKQIPAIEGTWTCSGSVKGQPEGPTTNFTHATVTAENQLKCKSTKSGIDGSGTLSSREEGSAGAYTPLAPTTVAT